MKRIILCTLILSLLFANRVLSDALQDCKDQIEELKDEAEHRAQMLGVLISCQKQWTEELTDIKRSTIQMLDTQRTLHSAELRSTRAQIKYMGELRVEDWDPLFAVLVENRRVPAKYFHSSMGWLEISRLAHRLWEMEIGNIHWHPYRIVILPDGQAQRHVNLSDPKLVECKEDLGDALLNLIVIALEEMEVYNASGRYPTGVPWYPDTQTPAKYEDVIHELVDAMQNADITIQRYLDEYRIMIASYRNTLQQLDL